MAKKRDKYVQKALQSLGLVPNDPEFMKTESDIDSLILNQQGLKGDLILSMEKAEKAMLLVDEQLENLQMIKKQILIEEYKDMNKGKNIQIY